MLKLLTNYCEMYCIQYVGWNRTDKNIYITVNLLKEILMCTLNIVNIVVISIYFIEVVFQKI